LPDLIYCPTGGIDAQKAKDYLALADVPCVGGSWLIASALLAAQDFGKVEQLARKASALGRRH
jgi:2-dehydro-3-deoxyphosphogluconate aldolase/(4S)-4-hydroxy-2-oxoglutarate aldolase